MRISNIRLCAAALLALAAGACVNQAEQQGAVDTLAARIESLETALSATQASVGQLSAAEESGRQDTAVQLTELRAGLEALPDAMAELCAASEAGAAVTCDEPPPVRTIVTSADKMILGELERVWIDPPGASLVARIDTGKELSVLRTESVTEFERDGDDWVRFDMMINKEATTLERRLKRHAKIPERGSEEPVRRPVVELRVRLGDVRDTFEFALVGHSSASRAIVLGRSFLTDIALVDVGKRYVQTPYQPAGN